jgi:hypothetical protein
LLCAHVKADECQCDALKSSGAVSLVNVGIKKSTFQRPSVFTITSTLMIETKDIHATQDFNSGVTRLIAGEVFSIFICKTNTIQSVNNATNCCSFFRTLSTQHVSVLNGHLQVSYYAYYASSCKLKINEELCTSIYNYVCM